MLILPTLFITVNDVEVFNLEAIGYIIGEYNFIILSTLLQLPTVL